MRLKKPEGNLLEDHTGCSEGREYRPHVVPVVSRQSPCRCQQERPQWRPWWPLLQPPTPTVPPTCPGDHAAPVADWPVPHFWLLVVSRMSHSDDE